MENCKSIGLALALIAESLGAVPSAPSKRKQFLGHPVLVPKVLAFADLANNPDRKLQRPSLDVQRDKYNAAKVKRQAKNAKRAALAAKAQPCCKFCEGWFMTQYCLHGT